MTSFRPTDRDSSSAVARNTHVVLGGEQLGLAIAERLRVDGHAVAVVDEAYEPAEVPGVAGNPAGVGGLAEAGPEAASSVVVGTRSDARNFLVAQLVRAYFDVPRTVVLVHDSELLGPLEEAGHEPLCVTTAVSEAVAGSV